MATDLVITWAGQTQPQVIALLERFGIKVAVFNAEDLKSLATTFVNIGESIQLKNARIAFNKALLPSFRKLLNTMLRHQLLSTIKPRVLWQLAMRPIFVAGGREILNDIVTQFGAVNAFKDINNVSFQTNINAIIEHNHNVIINTMFDFLNP